jgi:hypothetical protein
MFMSPSDRMCCWVVLLAYLCNSRAISTAQCVANFVLIAASEAQHGLACD